MSDDYINNEISSPPAAEHFLKRPAVDDLLKNAFKKPLTTVVAGAGYGKTQAVLAALRSMECKFSWMQISKLDNYTLRGWERFAYALKPLSHNLYENLLSLGHPESIVAFDRFLRLLEKELIGKEHFILVLDDFHLIKNKTILNFIELLISAHIQNFSIAIISRTKPNLSLIALQSKGLLGCITEDDLRFSKNEMDAYFQRQGIDLDKKIAREIYSYTDGWILAIYLVGLAIKKGDINNENPVLAAKMDIFDLIEKEIFKAVPKELQNTLIKISILESIPSGLLKELAGKNAGFITDTANENLFIRYDTFSDSYYIHNLFREFLLGKESRINEEDIKKMHLVAAEWYIKNNHELESIRHYWECGRYHEMFDIIFSITQRISKETADSFIELIDRTPEEIIKAKPVIRVAKAKYLFNNNRIDEAKRELIKIREEYEASPKTTANLVVLGEAYIWLGLISVVNLDYDFVELFKMADKCLPGGSKLIDNKANIAEGLNVCSIKDPSAGMLKKHWDALFNVAPYASKVMNGCGYGIENLNAAESSLYMGELRDAEKYAYEAIYRSRQYQQYDVECMANFVLVRIFTAKGQYAKISELLDQMKNQLEDLQNSDYLALYDVIKGWFYVKIRDTSRVPKWIKHEEETRKTLAPVILGREYLVRSDCLLAEERYYELLAFMEQTDRMYEARGILYARIQNKITRAVIHHYIGNYEQSISALHEAYELTHPNGLIMQYIEYGNQMRTLIHAARKNKSCKIPKEWLDKIYTKSSTYAKQLTQVVSAYNKVYALENANQIELSKRESEVLTYIGRGLTREEIAENCYLAIGTVNDILNNIYTKLEASNAADAVRIAKEKHIL